jgi:L-lactate dehydrogenase complex protein LldG
MAETQDTVLSRVSRALGRNGSALDAPIPPPIDEPLTRLVHTNFGLPELFAKRAQEMKMTVDPVTAEELLSRLTAFLKTNQCQKIALPVSPLLDRLQIAAQLKAAGFDARRWDEMTLDDLYEYDCGVTDVDYAVAETGSLVIRGSAEHGRAISLVPSIHVAIIEPKNFLPDLVDLFDQLVKDGDFSNATLITGPSKTSDIEMTLVVGVHGPCKVHLFILH